MTRKKVFSPFGYLKGGLLLRLNYPLVGTVMGQRRAGDDDDRARHFRLRKKGERRKVGGA